MNGKVEVTRRTLCTIAHSLVVHTQVLEAYIHSTFMYTEDNILPVLAIKYFINKDVDPATPFKIETGIKPSISNLRILFFPCVLRKATAPVATKAL